MALKKGDILEIEIETTAFGGKGLARVNSMVVFVDQALPGELVSARIVKKKKNWAEARLLDIKRPSRHRIKAPCPYSGFCGGCKWQFLTYPKQVEYKTQHVEEACRHIGLLENVKVLPTLASDNVFGYRNKMEFSCSDRRWLLPEQLGRKDIDTTFALGLHVPGTFYKVLDIDACLLQPDQGNQILKVIREYIRSSGEPVYGLRSHVGFWRFVVLRHCLCEDKWMVNLVTAEEKRYQVEPLAELLTKSFDNLASVVNNITARKAQVAFGEREILLAGKPYLVEGIGRYRFEISANSFFQTNTSSAHRLYEVVGRYCDLTGREKVLDLYCGAGTISIFLAAGAREVVGLEMVPSAVDDAVKNCRRNGIDNCSFIAGDIRYTLKQVTIAPDVMVIDPPRAGMHKDVVKQILAMAPARIVYVSCNPATMARDLVMMKDDYLLVEVQPVDMFPHTYHIESVALLARKGAKTK